MQTDQTAQLDSSPPRQTDHFQTPRGCNRLSVLAITMFVAVFACMGGSATAVPQLPGFPRPADSEAPNDDLQRLHTERRVVQQLLELDSFARRKKTVEFVDLLDGLRTADPALMVPGASGTFIPLHRELAHRVQGLSPEILKEISLDEAIADSALQRALQTETGMDRPELAGRKTGDGGDQSKVHALIDVLHRFAGTDAAWKAHLFLAAIHADRGHQQLAAYWLAPLLTAKSPTTFKAAAEKLSLKVHATKQGQSAAAKAPDSAPAVNGEASPMDLPSSDSSSSNDGVDKVPADDGSNDAQKADTRSADTPGNSGPLSPTNPNGAETIQRESAVEADSLIAHWMQSLPIGTQEKRRSQDLVQGASQHKILPWSAWEPIIDEDRIYIRTPQLISAFDSHSGNHIWTRTINVVRESLDEVDNSFPPFRMPMDDRAVNDAVNASEILLLHRNELVGRMTSDTERLFAVCQVSDNRSGNSRIGANQLRFIMGRGEQPSGGVWELVAVEKSTGRRLWTMGGPPVEARFGNDLAMAWFAGPPAVSGSQLFSVVEHQGAMQLTCLSASTGHLNWMIPLAYPDTAIALDSPRRLLSAWTLAERGLVITTTTTGWILAVDSMTHSVLWARRLPNPPTPQPGLRSVRNAAFLQSPLAPFGKVWRSETPILSDDSLIFAGAESTQLTVLDPMTGKIRYRSSADNATAILYCDPQLLVVSSPGSTIALHRPEMRRAWSKSRKDDEPSPVGSGVKSGESLLIPMSDGSIDALSLTNGNTLSNLRGLRPAFSSGGLYSTSKGIISYAPDHLAMMSKHPADRAEATDPFQQALFLMETGNLTDAKAALGNVQVHAMNAEPVRRLKFRIAVGLLTKETGDPETQLQEITGLARTNSEKALSQFLQLDRMVKESSETALPMLVEALQSGDSLLTTTIPDAEKLYETLRSSNAEEPLITNSLIEGSDSLRRPLRSWILQQLRHLLQNAAPEKKQTLVESLAAMSDEDLLDMHSSDLTSEYLRRAETHVQAATWSESTLHLLMAVVADAIRRKTASSEKQNDLSARIAAMFDQMDLLCSDRFSRDSARMAMVQRLLRVKRHELLSALKAEGLAPIETAGDALRKRWSEFNGRSYTMLPVNTNGQIMARNANLVPLEVVSDEDHFLTAYHWTLRHEPGGLIAESILDPSLPNWTMKAASSTAQFSMSQEELCRLGTVILLRKNDGLSAFSVVDQRWLWHRQMPAGVPRRMNTFADRPFREFNAMAKAQVASGRTQNICGGNDRWICLLNEGKVEVVDLLTGHSLWEISGVKSSSNILACDSFIASWSMTRDGRFNADPIEGTPTESATALRRDDADNIIFGTGNTVAVWNDQESDPTIDWMNPDTDEVLRSVPLTDMKYAHFMNPETLVAVTDEQTFLIVNLRTGSSRSLSYATEEGAAQNSSQMSASKIRVAADAINYYVFERSEDALRMIPSLYAMRADAVSKILYAVDRRSGKIAWALPSKNDLFVCIQPCTTSALFSISQSDRRGANAANGAILPNLGAPQRYTVAGISRTTGASLFSYPVVAQYPTGTFRLTENSSGQLDLDAMGNRVRYLPVNPAAEPNAK